MPLELSPDQLALLARVNASSGDLLAGLATEQRDATVQALEGLRLLGLITLVRRRNMMVAEGGWLAAHATMTEQGYRALAERILADDSLSDADRHSYFHRKRPLFMNGKRIVAWRELGVAVSMGHPTRPPESGLYFGGECGPRFLPLSSLAGPSVHQVLVMPETELVELFSRASAGWPA